MKSVNKIIAVSVMSMGLVSGLYCENRKLVATKSSDTSGWSAIQIWQNGSQVSAAKFKKSTASGAQYPQGQSNKYLFFDTDKGAVEVRFYWTASSGSGVEGGINVPPFIRVYSVNQLLQEAGKRKDKTPRITIDCPFGKTNVDHCTMKPIPVAASTVVQTQQASAAVPSEAPIKYTKVKVVKTDSKTHNAKWKVRATTTTAAAQKVVNISEKWPAASDTSGTVEILKDTNPLKKLKVPTNKNFVIIVNPVGIADYTVSEVIKAGTIKSGSVINIDGQGKATIK